MAFPEINMSGHGIEVTDAIRDYINEKLSKYEHIFDLAVSIDVECTGQVASRGVNEDFRVEVFMTLPKAVVRVEKSGADLYALVDEATDVLVRKVKRYRDKLRSWEGKEPWKVDETDDSETDASLQEFISYTPKVVTRKKLKDSAPKSEAEAIETMEMIGHDSIFFKNSRTGKYSMIYRRKKGNYGIVEPSD